MLRRRSRTSSNLLLPPIEATPKICGGQPHIRGTRVRVQEVALWHERLGLSTEEIVCRFPELSRADVNAALAYYRAHRAEIPLPLGPADSLAQQQHPLRGRRFVRR
jgi:uncharacterized protein (DUF433 family)